MTNTHPDIDYANKVILAPMVRIGTLPMRLLALEYGADLVWTEELVDKRIIGSVREYNEATGTIDYRKGKSLTFSTHPDEKGNVKRITATGIKALTVHCRTKEMRSTEKALWERLREVVEAVKSVRDIPVTVNGDIFQYADVEKVKKLTHADSAMIARGAQWNPSAFRKEGLLPFGEVVRAYIKKCVDTENVFQNTKYVILCMNTEDSDHTRSELYRNMQKSKSTEDLCQIFGLMDYYRKVTSEQQAKRKTENDKTENENKRERDDEDRQEGQIEKKSKSE
ncbi:Putative tRNA-dihydrouridine synthase 2 [Rhizopus microsporus]|nr:Putative tRNA-dihydrouridine synthase 2 [Rhizopus microsporus]